MKDLKISGYQLSLLVIAFIIGSSTIISPVHDGRDAWISYIMGWSGGFVLIFAYAYLALLNPGKTLVQILKDTFGKVGGSILALLYVWYFIHLAALVTRNFGFFLVTTTYERTPEIFMNIIFILLSAYTLKKGLQVLGRSAEILVPVLILFIIIITAALFTRLDYQVFFPVLEDGLIPVVKLVFPLLTFPFGETVAFLMLFSSLDKPNNVRRFSLFAMGTGGFFLFLILVRDIMTLGPDMIQRLYFPPAVSSELIPIMNLDPMIGVNLLIAGGIKISVCYYAAIVGITQIFDLDSYKPFVIPVGALIVAVAMWLYEDIFHMFSWASEVYPYYAVPFQLLIPFLLLGISIYKNTKKDKKGKKNIKYRKIKKPKTIPTG